MPPPSIHRPQDGSRDCGRFFLDVVGCFARDELTVTWSETPRQSSEEIDQLIDRVWDAQVRQAHLNGTMLYNGRLCRLIACRVHGGRLQLTVSEVSFKEFVGTNLTHAHLRYHHGVEVLADPLGLSAAVVTRDGFILLGRRSQQVFAYPGRLHPIAGTLEPPPDGSQPDPFQGMAKELTEELSLPAERIAESFCVGLIRDRTIVQPELVFDVHVSADVEEVLRIRPGAKDAGEHDEIVAVRDYPAAVVTFLEKHHAELTSPALAALLLHGQRHWSTGWFAAVQGYLKNVR